MKLSTYWTVTGNSETRIKTLIAVANKETYLMINTLRIIHVLA